MISVSVPCSCGEFIQGKFDGEEALISCPINIYSVVSVKKGVQKTHILEKSKKAIELVSKYYNLNYEMVSNLSIDIQTPLPHGKGYATSTAEIAGVIIAIATYFGKKISPIEVARLCVLIEPTDSTMFNNISLFKHLKGELVESVDLNNTYEIVILELENYVSTTELRNMGAFNNKYDDSTLNFSDFLSAIKDRDYKKMRSSMMKSAISNQIVLKKPYLNEISQMSNLYKAIGVNIAHSGSLIGVLFENAKEANLFEEEFKKTNYKIFYKTIRRAKVISGGWKIDLIDGGSKEWN